MQMATLDIWVSSQAQNPSGLTPALGWSCFLQVLPTTARISGSLNILWKWEASGMEAILLLRHTQAIH